MDLEVSAGWLEARGRMPAAGLCRRDRVLLRKKIDWRLEAGAYKTGACLAGRTGLTDCSLEGHGWLTSHTLDAL